MRKLDQMNDPADKKKRKETEKEERERERERESEKGRFLQITLPSS